MSTDDTFPNDPGEDVEAGDAGEPDAELDDLDALEVDLGAGRPDTYDEPAGVDDGLDDDDDQDDDEGGA